MVVKLTKLANISAPIRIMNSIAVVRALSTSTSTARASVERAARQREEKAPKAPMPAPSAAVNTPP